MKYFHNDYHDACHGQVFEKLRSIQPCQSDGYGEDIFCREAADTIRRLCENDSLAVHFLVGGTQTNLTVICAALRPHQGVMCADTAHIHVHETGAVEATGHKAITLPTVDGKICAKDVEACVLSHRNDASFEHMAQPKLVYISHTTELGTSYTLAELEELHRVCEQYGLYLFVDGARLAYALTEQGADVTLKDLARLTDVFYIGGTKCGAMFGEAVVISAPAIAEDFRYLIKQRGGMLAKGWLLGAQFQALLEDGLYFRLGQKANRMADKLRQTLAELGYPLYAPGKSNQIFAVLPDAVLARLGEEFTFSEQARVDDRHRAVRFCTSWASDSEDVEYLCRTLRSLAQA